MAQLARGECLILDDSFEHEVRHDGTRRRVVLIVDCWHPDLTEPEREFITHVHRVWRG
jgi:aspartate beta-hydroxylase